MPNLEEYIIVLQSKNSKTYNTVSDLDKTEPKIESEIDPKCERLREFVLKNLRLL